MPVSTPRVALEIKYDLPPVTYVIKKETTISYIRNKEVVNLESGGGQSKSHITYWENLEKKWELTKELSNRTNYNFWNNQFTINEASFRKLGEPIRSQINIYTDGSETDEHTGAGFIIYKEIASDLLNCQIMQRYSKLKLLQLG